VTDRSRFVKDVCGFTKEHRSPHRILEQGRTVSVDEVADAEL
jgi:hypothetical protein